MRRIKMICLLSAILLFVLSAASCSGGGPGLGAPAAENAKENGPGGDTGAGPENTGAKDPNYVSDLGGNDFGGYIFHVLGREIPEPDGSWNTFEIYAEQEDGTLINDAVYRRNIALEDKYNFRVKQTRALNSLTSAVRKSISAGDETYDLVLPPSREATTLATEGALADLKTVDNLNLAKGYWNQNLEKYTAVNGRLFYCTGDINIMDKQATWVLYFNKNMVTDLGLESPYNLVRSGQWTMDAFNEMLKDVTKDLNGDGKLDKEDQFGLLTHDGGLAGFNYYAGEPIVTKTSAGGLEITFNNERTINAVEKGIGILSGSQTYLFPDWLIGQNMFEAGQSLFYMEVLDKTGQLRNMEIPFGVLPPPKLDGAQAQYHTVVDGVAQLFCIPSNSPELSRAGLILEALGEGSAETLKEAYYDKNLTVKFVRDEDSVEMIELIMQGVIFDIGAIYGLGNMNGIVMNSIKRGANNFVSDYEKNIEKANAALQKFIEAFD